MKSSRFPVPVAEYVEEIEETQPNLYHYLKKPGDSNDIYLKELMEKRENLTIDEKIDELCKSSRDILSRQIQRSLITENTEELEPELDRSDKFVDLSDYKDQLFEKIRILRNDINKLKEDFSKDDLDDFIIS